MKENLKIRCIKTKNKILTKYKIPVIMPQLQFRLGIIAPSYSGKSNLIVNLLKNNVFKYNKIYKNNIFIFSKTAGLDDIYNELKLPKSNIIDNFDEAFINEILDEQTENINDGNSPNILFIIDDMVTDLDNQNQLIKKLFFNGRHYNLSTIITSQSYHKLPKDVRLNLSHLILFKIPDDDIKSVYKELPINKKLFEYYYDECTKKKYNFMYLDLKNQRWFHNFEYELFE
jgi:hypothetical protein